MFKEGASEAAGTLIGAPAGTTTTATPLNLTLNTRERTVNVAALQKTFIHMQYSPTAPTATGNSAPGAWEYTVPNNASYDVTVGVGDASFFDSIDTINVEGKPAIVAFVPSATNQFKTATVTVLVTNGKLTLDAKGGTNTKLDYVIIAATPKY